MWRHQQQDSNQDDPQYSSLRASANEEGDKMAHCFEESRRAYEAGDRAGAKTLSNEGKEHKAEMERLNGRASAWIYASKSSRHSHR